MRRLSSLTLQNWCIFEFHFTVTKFNDVFATHWDRKTLCFLLSSHELASIRKEQIPPKKEKN